MHWKHSCKLWLHACNPLLDFAYSHWTFTQCGASISHLFILWECNWVSLRTFHSSMSHMACITNLSAWTFWLSVVFVRWSHSRRAAGRERQETNSCQTNSSLMHGCFSRRGSALGLSDEMGHEVAVICTIKSTCFSSKLRLEMFSADIQSLSRGFMAGSSHWKTACSLKRNKCHALDTELYLVCSTFETTYILVTLAKQNE